MKNVCREILRAIHDGKLLSIEYKNKNAENTRYWIGIKNIDAKRNTLIVDGMHLTQHTIKELTVYVDSITSAAVIEGSLYPVNQRLIVDIALHPHKYDALFSNVVNIKILNYLADCNRLDCTPYRCDYSLLEKFDEECMSSGEYKLTPEQFDAVVREFQFDATSTRSGRTIKQICLNVLSINTKKGLYPLAYRKVYLDIKQRKFTSDAEITICKECAIDGSKQSIRAFLDADDLELLDDFDNNRERIKDRIIENNPNMSGGVDDNPYLMALGNNIALDLYSEYSAIIDMHNRGELTKPLQAFFGSFVSPTSRRKTAPIALINDKVNIDQLLAVHNAMKYPLTYVQGPPGTGKTNTIINTIATAFFNGRTVLFASYNNHPIDGVFKTLCELKYRNNIIPFPILRLGNNEKVWEATEYIKNLYKRVQGISVYDRALDNIKSDRIEKTKQLTELLKKHEDTLELKERRELIEKMLSTFTDLRFVTELQTAQLHVVDSRLKEIGEITDAEARSLVVGDFDEFYKYLYYTSAKYIKRLGEKRFEKLWEILNEPDEKTRVTLMNQYIADEECFADLIDVFPIVVTTCISAHKLGAPQPCFDMTIIDEASQCNTAVSLIPILRGKNLMLVGDPQQLQPVILLDANTNLLLRGKYAIGDEYDYIQNSVYKTFLTSDAVSDEVLLRYHYRCNKKIIDFNNRKYYNNKLHIQSPNDNSEPLEFIDVQNDCAEGKNTSPRECEWAIDYVLANRDKSIGIITPFVKQKNMINAALEQAGIKDVTCGTVHAFQGDEKDIIIFSLALTDNTRQSTYNWLKDNKELINVAVSRAKDKLILLAGAQNLNRLHTVDDDDIFELAEYVRTRGTSKVTPQLTNSRALGIKPFSTETEEAFLTSLNHALGNVHLGRRKYKIGKEIAISSIFVNEPYVNDLFYTGRFDFVIMDKTDNSPVFAIELDGNEHLTDEEVIARDKKKQDICKAHRFEMVRVPNTYARRYAYIKQILREYFSKA